MDVSISIVNYNTRDLLKRCLSSIFKHTRDIKFEIIVVDNASSDDSVAMIKQEFRSVKIISNHDNIFFTRANNQALKKASGRYFLILNSDTYFVDNSLKKMVDYMDLHKNIGACEGLEIEEDRSLIPNGSKLSTPLIDFYELSIIGKWMRNEKMLDSYRLRKLRRDTIFEIDVGCDAFLMVRIDLMKKLNGYDEQFLLYYTENDLCLRIKRLGYKIIHLGNAKVVHRLSSSVNKIGFFKKADIYYNDLFKYYWKHNYKFSGFLLFTLLKAEEFILRLRSYLPIIFIIILAVFLRFYRISENFWFDGEIGDNLLDIKNAILSHHIPLHGPPTSHPWLYFGPLFYWLYGPILYLSNFNPVSHAYFGAFVSTLIVIINYFVVKRMFNNRVALLSSYFIAISPLFLFFSRVARFFSIVPLLVYPFIWFLYKASNGEKKYLFWMALLFGLMLNFHYTLLMLVPLIIMVFTIKKIKLTIKDIFIALVGFFIPLSPLLYFDSSHNFKMVTNLLLWIPYRIAGFLGMYDKNTVNLHIVQENGLSFFEFVSRSFIPQTYSIFGFLFIVALIVFLFSKLKNIRTISFPFLIILLWLFWGFLAIFIHGSPPPHYFVPLLSIPILLFSCFLNDISFYRKGAIITMIILITITIVNTRYYFSDQWFYKENKGLPSYALQKKVAHFIIDDAKGVEFNLKRVGSNDQFEKNYAQNYIYLLWWYGNEPKEKAKITYTIYEDLKKLSHKTDENRKFFQIGNIAISKLQ